MPRGFTLLELMITVAVLSALLATAAPSFKNVFETNKMQRLANELHGFVIEGKSEAVLRRERLWAHIIMSGSSSSDGNWRIDLTDNAAEGLELCCSLYQASRMTVLSLPRAMLPIKSASTMSMVDHHQET